MKEKFEKGIRCLRPPMGYDIIRINGLRKIIVNDTGKKIGKAFLWKAQGMKNEEIMKRLKRGGVPIYKQKLSTIFSNPFYCGVIVNKMLDGRMIEGEHEKIISQDIFLKANQVRAETGGKYGVAHSKEIEQLPLKVFMKCDDCGQGYTGYIVRAKNLWYYKCRTKGCFANKSAILVNKSFATFIDEYTIKPGAIDPLNFQMKNQFGKLNENYADEQKAIKCNLSELQKKIDNIDEDYYIKKVMPGEKYENFLAKFSLEKQEINDAIARMPSGTSNLEKLFSTAITISSKLPEIWASGGVKSKETLQELLFPLGVRYSCKNEAFRTDKVNEVFQWISGTAKGMTGNKNGQTDKKIDLSNKVGLLGFEPRQTESKSVVLPLHHNPILSTCFI